MSIFDTVNKGVVCALRRFRECINDEGTGQVTCADFSWTIDNHGIRFIVYRI